MIRIEDARQSPNDYFWEVEIAWVDKHYCTAGCHVGFEFAENCHEAVRLTAEWRNTPPGNQWTSVSTRLRSTKW